MTMQTIRAFNAEREDIEELVLMLATALTVKEQFEALELDVPEWLEPKIRAIRREVTTRNADRLEKRLAEAKLRMDSLKTPVQRKAELQAEITKLNKQLAAVR